MFILLRIRLTDWSESGWKTSWMATKGGSDNRRSLIRLSDLRWTIIYQSHNGYKDRVQSIATSKSLSISILLYRSFVRQHEQASIIASLSHGTIHHLERMEGIYFCANKKKVYDASISLKQTLCLAWTWAHQIFYIRAGFFLPHILFQIKFFNRFSLQDVLPTKLKQEGNGCQPTAAS